MSQLPFRTDLRQLRRRAKDLLRAAEAGDPQSTKRILAVGPRISLASAQLAVARELGFPGWARLKADAERKEAEKAEAGWHNQAVFGGWFEEESQTDRETHYHKGSCRNCGARYEFETNIVRGFADFVEAKCPKCGGSLGEFREDVGISILVRLTDEEGR